MEGFPTFKGSWPWRWIGLYCIWRVHQSTATYMPNLIEIKVTFCGRTYVCTDGHLRPTLLGWLKRVHLKPSSSEGTVWAIVRESSPAGRVGYFSGCSQWFKFSSVLWHCWLCNRNNIRPNYPKGSFLWGTRSNLECVPDRMAVKQKQMINIKQIMNSWLQNVFCVRNSYTGDSPIFLHLPS